MPSTECGKAEFDLLGFVDILSHLQLLAHDHIGGTMTYFYFFLFGPGTEEVDACREKGGSITEEVNTICKSLKLTNYLNLARFLIASVVICRVVVNICLHV
jgi:hypothetical protein